MNINFQSIGTIHTPFLPSLPIPQQPIPQAPGEFWISLNSEYTAGLEKLTSYRYITVIYYLDKVTTDVNLRVNPPWAPGVEVGLFASRSPVRPNPIGLSIVELKGIEGNEILISGIDVYNGTPLLDIKPYVKAIDCKPEANDGWCDELPDKDHVFAHLLDRPHHHEHSHEHSHDHPSNHSHEHPHDHGHSHHAHSQSHSHQHPKKTVVTKHLKSNIKTNRT